MLQLSQLAGRSNVQQPTFKPTEFSKFDDYKSVVDAARESEKYNNAKAYGKLYGQAKLTEGLDKNIDITKKAETAKLKLDELGKIKARKDELIEKLNSVGPVEAQYIERQLSAIPSDIDAQYEQAKTEFTTHQSSLKSAMSPYVLQAAKVNADPSSYTSTSKDKDVVKMAEYQSEIDNKWVAINEQLKIYSDPKSSEEVKANALSVINTLKTEAIELGRQYTIASQGATYKSPYEDDYYRVANADKNINEAMQSKMSTGKQASDIKKALIDDASELVKVWSEKNKTVVDKINKLSSVVQAFETLKGNKELYLTPSGFAALTKQVNKMVLPDEAVMADDVKLFAKFGGGESNLFSQMAMIGTQITSAVGQLATGLSKVAEGMGNAVSRGVSDIVGGETSNKPTVKETIAKTGDEAYATASSVQKTAQGEIDKVYKDQAVNIIKLGELYATKAKELISSVKGKLASVILRSTDYISFRNTEAIAAATGKTVAEILNTDEAKNALSVAIDSQLDSQFTSININDKDTPIEKTDVGAITGADIDKKNTPEAPKADVNTTTQETQKTTQEAPKNASAEVSKADAKFLSPIGTPGTMFGEVVAKNGIIWKWVKESKSTSGGRWINNGKVKPTQQSGKEKTKTKPKTQKVKVKEQVKTTQKPKEEWRRVTQNGVVYDVLFKEGKPTKTYKVVKK